MRCRKGDANLQRQIAARRICMAQQIAIRIVNIKLRARAAALVSLAILAAILLTIPTAQAQTFTVLHTFTGGGDGADSLAGLTFDRAGNLYGTTHSGGTSSGGTVFKLKK